jgi:hypothetical protein
MGIPSDNTSTNFGLPGNDFKIKGKTDGPARVFGQFNTIWCGIRGNLSGQASPRQNLDPLNPSIRPKAKAIGESASGIDIKVPNIALHGQMVSA